MQEVSRENLVPGKEYYLQNFETSCAPPNKPYKMIAKFEKLDPCSDYNFKWACFINFRKIKDRNDPTCDRRVKLTSHWRYYDVPRDKVQKTMENRAYNMILVDLIKDDYFTPVDFI
jgi:hypothetical protein